MKISPSVVFWLMFFATIAQGVSGGTVHLTGIVPSEAIPTVTGWVSFINFIVMSFLTLATGTVGVGAGPLAPKPTVEEAQKVMDQAKGAGK